MPSVTEHPALRNAARSIAWLYDSLRAPEHRAALTVPLVPGEPDGAWTHRCFVPPRSREELLACRSAIERWSGMTYGWMGRTPDYKAALTNALGSDPSWFGPLAGSALGVFERARARLPFIAHAIVNPPVDRHLAPGQPCGAAVRVVAERDDGIIVRGAKVVATSAAIADWLYIGHTPICGDDDPDAALAFVVPLSTPGLRLHCRESYELAAHRAGSVFDHPLSSRFDENDAIVVLDDVLVPWDRVLIYRDPDRTRSFFEATGFVNGYLFHGCTRLAVKLEFLAGLLSIALRATGNDEHRGCRADLGQVIAYAHTFAGLSMAMASNPDPGPGGTVLPERRSALASSVLAPECMATVRTIVQRTIASALVYLPPSPGPEERSAPMDPAALDDLERYCRGSRGMGHARRLKIMRLLWDACCGAFAGRHDLYEQSYAGGWDAVRLQAWAEAERLGRLESMRSLAQRCMDDYDERGWCRGPWLGPESRVAPQESGFAPGLAGTG